MNPGVPNWEAMNQPKTENPHLWDPAYGLPAGASAEAGGKPLRSHGQVRASPVRVEWVSASRAFIALNVRSSAPVPYPTKTGTPTAPAARMSPSSLMNGRDQGATQSLLGRRDPLRSWLRAGSVPFTGPVSTEPAWLFGLPAEAAAAQEGRMPSPVTRRRLNTRQ
jgi:hypothetical protein